MVGELFYNSPQAERNRTNFTKTFFMSRSSKLFIGILSFLPIVLVFVMFFMALRLIPTFIEWGNNGHNYEPAPQEVFTVFGPMFILGFGIAILSVGLLIFFIMHLIRHKAMDSTFW